MTEEELTREAQKLIQRFERIKIVGEGWSGNVREGWNFHRSLGGGITIAGTSFPAGACCVGSDCSIQTESSCGLLGGLYLGDGTGCVPNPCITLTGVCCFNGACLNLTESECIAYGGEFLLGGTCSPNPCPGACCDIEGVCHQLSHAECDAQGWTFIGGLCGETTCEPGSCPCCCQEYGTHNFYCISNTPSECLDLIGGNWSCNWCDFLQCYIVGGENDGQPECSAGGGCCYPNPFPPPNFVCGVVESWICEELGGTYCGNFILCGDPQCPASECD